MLRVRGARERTRGAATGTPCAVGATAPARPLPMWSVLVWGRGRAGGVWPAVLFSHKRRPSARSSPPPPRRPLPEMPRHAACASHLDGRWGLGVLQMHRRALEEAAELKPYCIHARCSAKLNLIAQGVFATRCFKSHKFPRCTQNPDRCAIVHDPRRTSVPGLEPSRFERALSSGCLSSGRSSRVPARTFAAPA